LKHQVSGTGGGAGSGGGLGGGGQGRAAEDVAGHGEADANSRNLAGTARALYIHANTLLKRIERIGGLLGHDWQQPDHALRLQLAVHLHDLVQQVEQVG
jgi:hypothetical protein